MTGRWGLGVARSLRGASLALLALPVLAGGAAAMTPAAPTYEQVLAAPDDVELNLAYAKSEIAGGRLLSAAAAYERVLIIHPDWDSTRLAYARVLYQLDDRTGALQQTRMLDTRKLTPAEKEEAARYLHELQASRRSNFGRR